MIKVTWWDLVVMLTKSTWQRTRDIAIRMGWRSGVFLALFLVACPQGHERVDANACLLSFPAVVEAWEAQIGPVPTACRDLSAEYSVELGPLPEACEDAQGCTFDNDRQIFMLATLTPEQNADLSAHEWIHALASCIDDSMDVEHERSELWSRTGVWGDAYELAPIGPCLSRDDG